MIAAKSPHLLEHAVPRSLSRNQFTIRRVNFPSPTRRMKLSWPTFSVGEIWPLTGLSTYLKAPTDSAADEVELDAVTEPEHLVIMVNGINGSAADWRYGANILKTLAKVLVHCSKSNYAKKTYDGVDIMGIRLANEVEDIVKYYPSLKKISFVAHSLGGLIARYAIGKLYSDASDKNEHGRIAGLEPINFITVATPHLGSRGNKQLPFLCGLPFLERRASQAAHFIAGRSGKHLFLTDRDNNEEPLLLRMVNDSDLKFMSALGTFKRRVAYANANYDHMVGWRTSSIRRQNELPQPIHLKPIKGYVYVVSDPDEKLDKGCPLIEDELEEKLVRGLTQVHWERVDVSFEKSRQRFIAHNTIQVKRAWLKDGEDVVNHIRDHFLL